MWAHDAVFSAPPLPLLCVCVCMFDSHDNASLCENHLEARSQAVYCVEAIDIRLYFVWRLDRDFILCGGQIQTPFCVEAR